MQESIGGVQESIGRRGGLKGSKPRLPAARVVFDPNYRRRVAALQLRLAAARQSRDGSGLGAAPGSGGDLVGFRPYRPGEDLRQLDWNLLARLDRPFVRVTQREAGEHWVVVLDASASMGVGPPGKLQRGAECAGALVALAGRLRAEVELVVTGGAEERPRRYPVRAREGHAGAFAFLEEQVAAGPHGLASALRTSRVLAGAARVFLIGDVGGLEPRDVLGLRRGSREVRLLQLLAPSELEPRVGAREWWDPETAERLRLDVDEARRERYLEALEDRLEFWRALAARHRLGFAGRSTAEPFEALVEELFAG